MKKDIFRSESLLSWHREMKSHPLFKPENAKENLVSLAETIVLLYLAIVTIVLTLHFFVLSGYFKPQTLPLFLSEGAARILMGKILGPKFNIRAVVFLAIITTIVLARVAHYSFDLIKADFHSKRKETK